MLTKHEAADKTKSASEDFPYIPCIADSFFYCCLPSLITSTEVHHPILPVKPLSCTVMWLAIRLADFSFGVCINCKSGISAAATFFFFVILSISTHDLLCQRFLYVRVEEVRFNIHHHVLWMFSHLFCSQLVILEMFRYCFKSTLLINIMWTNHKSYWKLV